MQKLQDSVFSIIKTTNLSPAVFSFLQPTEDFTDITPLGGILRDTKLGWLALGPKFCVVDLRSGLKVAARTFGTGVSNSHITVSNVIELPTPLTENSHQLVISLDYDNITGMICVLHVNGSQILRCIHTDVVITKLAICDGTPDAPFAAFDNIVAAGTKRGEIMIFDLNRASLIKALKDISQGYEHLVLNEENAANIKFLPLKELQKIEEQRDLAIENEDHLGFILNEDSSFDGQYIFRNPDGSVRMKAKRDHIRVTSLQYFPEIGSLAVGFNFGAFQLWNLLTLGLEFTSQVNVECLPVTHFGFQEPCDDPKAFCYLWVVFSVIDRFEEEEFPLAVMYSLSYQGKRILTESKCLYQDFSSATIRFQIELNGSEQSNSLIGGRCISCHTYTISSPLGEEGEDSMINITQLVWECWGEGGEQSAHYGMMLFDLDQWYKDQMPATYHLESNAFMSVLRPAAGAGAGAGEGGAALDARLVPASLAPYSHATRLEEHFYPNSLQYNCICLNTSEATVLGTVGVQRQIINSIDEAGPTALLAPGRLHLACVTAGLTPLYVPYHGYRNITQEDQRRFLLSVALEARLTRFLKRCAHDWATGTHTGLGCTLSFLVEWCWKRAIELKENAKELVAPLFASTILPDRNIMRCLEHCVQQLTQLTGLLDAILTKCCNLVVPDALSEMEEKYKGIGIVSLYLQVVQWFLRAGLLPERAGAYAALPYPAHQLYHIYNKRRVKLHRVQEAPGGAQAEAGQSSCGLLYIDQLIEHEFGGIRTHEMWLKGGSECGGVYPPPSLYSLLRLYLLPDIAEEHKHSLVLYLLLDYCTVYDEIRYEAVIRRLMQFPTMFGLSNTAIKATQAFWHLDHRDFDFALDQLQCLTGNTLSDWQHRVVLSSLLAQKKTQAALQYLHVRKPAPIQSPVKKDTIIKVNDNDKLEDWQCCCNLYLARGLVFEAIDVVRMCVRNALTSDEKVRVLNFFYKGCRNSGQLSKVLQVTLLPGEDEVFIKYLKDCNDTQTSDILIMYYLQQGRYLEAEEHNNKLKEQRSRKELSTSAESLAELVERCNTRDTLLSAACAALPDIACNVASTTRQLGTKVIVPKPMSVYVQVTSPKNTFTYKSTFIQDTIDNTSETWTNKPRTRKGLKRALEIEETPFICTPKLNRTKSLFLSGDNVGEVTPAKRTKLQATSPKTPNIGTYKASAELSQQMATLLDMPEAQSPYRYHDRSETGTPHSILKSQRLEGMEREVAASPVDSRYLCDSGDDLIETASNKTNYSDSKHLRFQMPSDSESSSSPPVAVAVRPQADRNSENGDDTESETSMESPPKKLATEGKPQARKSYKDNVRARRSLSISVNSSLSDDPNASIESIADIPITLINPRYSHKGRQKSPSPKPDKCMDVDDFVCELRPLNETPRGRRSIREISGQSTPLTNRSRSVTPERQDSPVLKTLQTNRATRSRSRTPEMSPGALECIPEQPRRESASAPHAASTALSLPTPLRSRSRTPELVEKTIMESAKLSAITGSPAKYDSAPSHTRRGSRSRSYTPESNKRGVAEAPALEPISEAPARPCTTPTPSPPTRALRSRSRTPDVEKIPEQPISSPRSLRSRSRTPEVERVPEEPVSSPRSLRSRSRTPDIEKLPEQPILSSPRSLRSRSKTPEKLLSPKKDTASKGRKPLSRLVLEANAFAKTKQIGDISEIQSKESSTEQTDSVIECTPLKASNTKSLIDVTFSPIVNKSILQSSTESFSVTEKVIEINESTSSSDLKPLPAFTSLHEVYFEKSVLQTDESSIVQSSLQEEMQKSTEANLPDVEMNELPQLSPISESDFNEPVLNSGDSSVAGNNKPDDVPKAIAPFTTFNETEFDNSVLKSHLSSVEISHDSNPNEGKSYTNLSSLMTSDSDIEMVDDQNWKYKIDNENNDSVIQKEKEKIVEIEREINEIEEDIAVGGNSSDEENAEDSSGGENVEQGDSSDEEIVQEEENKEESAESEEADDEVSVSDSSDDVICIDDDSDSNPADVNPQNKQTSEEIPQTDNTETQTENIDVVENIANTDVVGVEIEKAIENVITEVPIYEVCQENTQESYTERIIEVQMDQDFEMKVSESVEQSVDVLNQANISLLTDDNSDINLTYSDDSNHKVAQLGEIVPVEIENNEVIPSNIQDIDVDPCQPVNIETTSIEKVIIQEHIEEEMNTVTAPIEESKDIFAENIVKETVAVTQETKDICDENTVKDTPDILETESFNKNAVETPMEVITATEDIAENVKTDIIVMSETKISEVTAMPETKISEVTAIPETKISEVTAMPEIKISKVMAMPETKISEVTAMPETKIREVTAIPEIKISEVTAMPETKTSEGTAMPETKISEVTAMPETKISEVTAMPETKISEVTAMPEIKISKVTAVPETKISEVTAMPETKISEVTAMPETKISEVTAMPETKISEVTAMPEIKISKITAVPETEIREVTAMPEIKISKVTAMPETKIREVTAMPEIKISKVTAMPETKISKVTAMPETKVKEVTAMPEIKISKVMAIPVIKIIKLTSMPEIKISKVTSMPEIKDIEVTEMPKPMVGEIKEVSETKVSDSKDIRSEAASTEETSEKDQISTKVSSGSMEIDQNEEIEETKAPAARKRTQSTTSNKSNQEIEQEISVNPTLEATTPSKRVSKSPMPKSRVMPKRRSSKDVDEMDESVTSDELLTPRRRSTRSRSKNIDDNSSVASESSVKSSTSKIEEPIDKKPVVRKGRKSILNTKIELCVIPEIEDNSQKIEESSEDILNEILATERLTRHQKALLESKLRPSTPRGRRASAASKSEASVDEDTSDTHLDRVQLLDKQTFDGRADDEEFPRATPALSDTVRPRPRTARSASETETQAKAKKIIRRTSVDISLDASPVLGRRASFNRACEALHTPKGRRPSVDTKREAEGTSPEGAEATPRRRARRPSQLSDTPTSDLGKRSRRTAVDKYKESAE